MSQFQVRKDDFLTQRLVPLGADATDSPLALGQIRLAVDSFSFTANNITYAAAGDMLGYWQFFTRLWVKTVLAGASSLSGALQTSSTLAVIR